MASRGRAPIACSACSGPPLLPWDAPKSPDLGAEPGIDFLIDISKYRDAKAAALRAHRTQHVSINRHFFDLPNVDQILSVEAFRQAFGPPLSRRPSADIFESVVTDHFDRLYSDSMRKLGIVVLSLMLVVAGLAAAGFRLQRGGNGWPRFIARSQEEALEADRARQRESASAFAPTAPPAPVDKPVALTHAFAPAHPSHPRIQLRTDFAGRAPALRSGQARVRFGPTSAARIATGAIPRRRSARAGRAKGCGGCGSSRSAAATRRSSSPMAARSRSSSGAIEEVVAAYDMQTGRELWTNGWTASFEESMGGDGPRATPTYHEGRVYALGAEGELRVLDAAKGTLVWRRNILTENGADNLSWGMSASPLIVDDKVDRAARAARAAARSSPTTRRRATSDLEGAERRGGVHVADARRRSAASDRFSSSRRHARSG